MGIGRTQSRSRSATSSAPTFPHCPELLAAWETPPAGLDDRWRTLLGAFAAYEFAAVDLPAPTWTTDACLNDAWVLDTPRLTDDEVIAQTPAWLAARNIYIAIKDLGTL